MSNYAIIISGNSWKPGIGDPTLLGLLTVFAYFSTAFCCFKCGQKNKKDTWIWWGLGLILFLLGINKQLDLQSWFTMVGKRIAIEQGWYEQRRLVQKDFIVGLIAIAGASFMFLIQGMGTKIKQFMLPLIGLTFLLIFIIIRATSFHHVDQLLNWELAGFRLNWLLELGGISCITIAAIKEIFQTPTSA
ncbi:MAG: hypothetical protein QNJ42_03105 [Crocosphaera sp.]|nr:hypothetical protein [Crocosphaera sp.]